MDIWNYFTSLFKKSEESTSSNPFIHELIERSEDEKKDFEFWKETVVAKQMLNWLSDQYALHLSVPDRVDSAIKFLNTPSSKGFAIHFNQTNYSRREVTHFFDWLKEKVRSLDYRTQISDRRVYKKGDGMETVEKHYLKPRPDFTSKEKFNQGYGNITITMVLQDEEVQHLKLIATVYSDRLYKDAADFKDLMQAII